VEADNNRIGNKKEEQDTIIKSERKIEEEKKLELSSLCIENEKS